MPSGEALQSAWRESVANIADVVARLEMEKVSRSFEQPEICIRNVVAWREITAMTR